MKQKILGLIGFPKKLNKKNTMPFEQYKELIISRDWIGFIDYNARMTLKALAKRGGSEELPSTLTSWSDEE